MVAVVGPTTGKCDAALVVRTALYPTAEDGVAVLIVERIGAVGRNPAHIGGIAELLSPTQHPCRSIEATEGASLGVSFQGHRSLACPSEHLDHPGHRVRTIEDAAGPAQY